MEAGLRVQHGGRGEPVLLLLHGLGATGDVWDAWRPLLDQRWPGRWLAPDLPGHGGSRPLPGYTFETLAAALASIVGPGTRTVVLGHSLGGVVGLALASGEHAVPVQAVIGLGIKVAWTEEDLGRARAAAQRPPAWFPSRDEAAARYLRISGLAGLLTATEPAVQPGLQERHGRWRLAMDPGAFAVGAPDMTQLLARCQAPVTLARGEHDAMNTDEQLTELGVPTVTLPGLGHNAHVESPRLSITLLDPHRELPGQEAEQQRVGCGTLLGRAVLAESANRPASSARHLLFEATFACHEQRPPAGPGSGPVAAGASRQSPHGSLQDRRHHRRGGSGLRGEFRPDSPNAPQSLNPPRKCCGRGGWGCGASR
jgi:pimeloyl-ACP methyl ester carboxylesterase